MNPPTTPYTVYPTTPPATGKRPAQTLTYSQGHRGSQPVLVSPPRTGVQPQWIQRPPRDPRYDPRPRYMSEQVDGPDLKRRRYDGGYVPGGEVYREVPYPYSPREAQYVRADMHHDPHGPRSAMIAPPRALYPQQPPLPPKLQPIRPPPPQHKRNPSMTLPPLTTPSAQIPSSAIARQGSQNSGLEAMIMSIPVLNKVKILSQISPHLANPSVASPPRQIRGAIVAVEGLDPASTYSMTNSLAEQLLKDGKFNVEIFSGPDPFATFREDSSKERKDLAIADCLGIIGEWHKISEEMKRFITTKPVGSTAVSPDKDVEMSSSLSNSVVTTDVPTSEPSTEQTKTPERTHSRRPSKLDLQPPTTQPEETLQSASSKISPKSMVTDQTANLTISTPPVQKGFRDPWYRSENPDSPPYTRIPSIAARGGAISTSTQPASEDSMEVEEPSKPIGAKEVHFDSSADAPSHALGTPNNTPRPSLATNTGLSDTTIPIALVPHYQLTTVDASAIAVPIVDAYSPLAHWQWLATLWRGCVGPDVSVVIKSTATAGPTDGVVALEDGSPAKTGIASPRSRQMSMATQAGGASAPASAAGANGSVTSHPAHPAAVSAATAPGVEVRLLDHRTVVVRTNVSHHNNGKKDSAAEVEDEELTKKKKEETEFWEKAKRRVGFEVAEFLRR